MLVKLNVINMNCEHCQKNVEDALNKMPGVKKVMVELPQKEVTIDFDENQVTPHQMIDALAEAKYEAKIL